MKTKSGLEILDFKKLETPIDRGILESHIYEGIITDVPMTTPHNKTFNAFIS